MSRNQLGISFWSGGGVAEGICNPYGEMWVQDFGSANPCNPVSQQRSPACHLTHGFETCQPPQLCEPFPRNFGSANPCNPVSQQRSPACHLTHGFETCQPPQLCEPFPRSGVAEGICNPYGEMWVQGRRQ
ncbi:uncharacterized protein PS065_009321 [Dugong dugon]